MNSYIALTRMYWKLTTRDRSVLFFNFLFPLMFFFLFGQLYHAERGTAPIVVNMVLTIGVLGGGLFGAGIRATMDREANILRRFKVAPITPAPILVASLIVGVLNFVPVYLAIIFMAHFFYGMPIPSNLLSMMIFITIGLIAFRGIGLIIASVANSMNESQIFIQVLYMPMLFLSGATIPLSIMPTWVQVIGNFLPATHLFTGMQAIIVSHEGLGSNLSKVTALLVTAGIGTFIAMKLFRWEKEEKISGASKLWVLAVLAPFIVMGVREAYSKENVAKNKILAREIDRNAATLIKNARIFVGDGTVIESGSVLLREGKINQIFTGVAPEAKSLKAYEYEAAGQTLLPGLIDTHVHLQAPGGFYEKQTDYKPDEFLKHAVASYLFSGVIAVRSAGDVLDPLLRERAKITSGERLGPEIFVCGPLFTTEGGHGTQYFPGVAKTPKSAEEAARMVGELKQQGVDAIKAALDAGRPGQPLKRMDLGILKAIIEAAHAQKLPVLVHTAAKQDVIDALDLKADGIEHGSVTEELPEELFQRMRQNGVMFAPTLAAVEGLMALGSGKADVLDRSLVQRVTTPELMQGTRKFLGSPNRPTFPFSMEIAQRNLKRAFDNGVVLVTGTDSGNPLTLHGPAVHREMQLWVQAGVPNDRALLAGTLNGASALRVSRRLGLIKTGYDASIFLVNGNPLQTISATEQISSIWFKGERVNRGELLEKE